MHESTMVVVTNVAPGRADRDEYLQPWQIARVEPWGIGENERTAMGARITLDDNEETTMLVAESAAEVTRRIDAARLSFEQLRADPEPSLMPIARIVAERLPWRAIGLFAWAWAIYQLTRVASLLQDIFNEHVRMFGRDMLLATHELVEAAVSGVAGMLAFLLVGMTFALICLLSMWVRRAARWAWRRARAWRAAS